MSDSILYTVKPAPDGQKVRFATDAQSGETLDAQPLAPKPLRIKAKVRRKRYG